MRATAATVLLAACAHVQPAGDVQLRLYLARHGQTDWNAAKRLQGGTDRSLNDTGRAQAAALARLLDGVRLDHVYTSGLARSQQTAAALRDGAPRTALPELNEQSLGKFEGLLLDGSSPDGAAEFERRSVDPLDTLDGGESSEQHFARVQRALAVIRAAHPSGNVLIVGHGGTNALLLRALLELPGAEADKIQQANDEVYAIDLAPGRPPRVWKLIPPDRLADL
jgi:2,3-bisphosphoglycerate-dependent phosphoglycerate mutase